jgi:hypothetical protein
MLMPRNYRPAVSAGTLDPRLPIKIRRRGRVGGWEGGKRKHAFAPRDIAYKHSLRRVASSLRVIAIIASIKAQAQKVDCRVQSFFFKKKIRADVAD